MSDKQLPPSLYDRIFVVVRDADGWLSRREIAVALGLKKTPHLFYFLEALVDHGHVEKTSVKLPNGFDMFYYTLAAKYREGA